MRTLRTVRPLRYDRLLFLVKCKRVAHYVNKR